MSGARWRKHLKDCTWGCKDIVEFEGDIGGDWIRGGELEGEEFTLREEERNENIRAADRDLETRIGEVENGGEGVEEEGEGGGEPTKESDE